MLLHLIKNKLLNVVLLLSLAVSLLASCKKEADLSHPIGRSAPSLAELKTWYGQQSSSKVGASYTAGRGQAVAQPTPLALQWEKHDTLGNETNPLAWVPIEGTPAQQFTPDHQGYRRLVAGYNEDLVAGVIVEVIHNGPALAPAQVNALFRQLYNAWQRGQVAQLPGFSGLAAFYSRENYYLTGRLYRRGIASEHPAWLRLFSVADADSTSQAGKAGRAARAAG